MPDVTLNRPISVPDWRRGRPPIKIDSNWARIDVESIEVGKPQPDGTRPLQVRFSKARYKLQQDGSVRDIQTNDVFSAEAWKSAISQMIGAVANGPPVKSPERPDLYERLQERSEAIGYALEHPESIEQPQSPENPLTDLVGLRSRSPPCVSILSARRNCKRALPMPTGG